MYFSAGVIGSGEELPQLAQARVEPLARELELVERREERRASRARQTQKVRNCESAICGPVRVKTTGWMKLFESRIARNEIGISTTPKSA